MPNTSLAGTRLPLVSSQAMEDTMDQTDRHPIVSFISALFWVVREFSSMFPSA